MCIYGHVDKDEKHITFGEYYACSQLLEIYLKIYVYMWSTVVGLLKGLFFRGIYVYMRSMGKSRSRSVYYRPPPTPHIYAYMDTNARGTYAVNTHNVRRTYAARNHTVSTAYTLWTNSNSRVSMALISA